MCMIKYIDRFQRMDALIQMRATGTPERFAEKLGIKRSTMFLSLQEMRNLGADIRYSCSQQSYYYVDGKRLKLTRNSDTDL